jgi:predicted nucleotide-binding protein (sugar kinase/HSP70/actin superfamily)
VQRHASPKGLFWIFSERTLRATRYFAGRSDIDGIIHLSAFGCGPDSIVDRFIQLDNYSSTIPFMSLTIDEHSGEAGVGTRLEAFVDMVKRKKRGVP